VDAVNNIGEIALHAACENGNEYIVKILLKYNSNVNLCDTGGLAPLHFACIYGNTDVVQILIDNDCDINKSILDPTNDIVSYENFSEIFEIYRKHNIDMILYSVYDMYDMSDSCSSLFSFLPIVLACFKGHTDIVKLLLDNNCHVIDNNGFSPALYCACRGGSVDVVDLLLRNKCNINQCQTRADTNLLIVACDKNQEAVAKMLLSYEACDVNITDCDNRNALHYACKNGQADVVELLLRRHCNVNLNDR
jgi:ankyrin repeat protein